MKKLLLLLLLAFAGSTFAVAQYTDKSGIFRIKGIYIDEVNEDGDEGVGATIEIALITQELESMYQTIGFEIGYIKSDAEDSGNDNVLGFVEGELDTDLIPLFFNYTIGSNTEYTDFVIEGGVGIGGVVVDYDLSFDSSNFGSGSGSDDDFVFAGQIFGRIGYKLTEDAQVSLGVRYMLSEDAEFFGEEIPDTLNTVAFDIGLNSVF